MHFRLWSLVAMFSNTSAQPTGSLIRRLQITSDETSPWEGIAFVQPVGSDRLSDELKRAYPGCTNLRQRKHMAAIAFLQYELMQMQSANTTSRVLESKYPVTPEESSLSNDNFDGTSRHSSVSVSQTSLQKAQAWPGGTPNTTQSQGPAASAAHSPQQIVFSVSDGHTLLPTTRRTMTKEEKLAYRKTRKRGACSTCRRQKEKVSSKYQVLAACNLLVLPSAHIVGVRSLVRGFPKRRSKSKRGMHTLSI